MEITVRQVQKAVADYYEISIGHLLGTSRNTAIVRPRWLAMWLSRAMTGASFPVIGEAFRKDHTTVIHAINRLETLFGSNPSLKGDATAIRERLIIAMALEREGIAQVAKALDEPPEPAILPPPCPTCGQTVVSAVERQKIAATLRMGMAAVEQGVRLLER